MKPSAPAHLLLALSVFAAGVLSAAPAERPRMEDFPSSFQFLQALKTWNQAHPDGVVIPQAEPTAPAPVAILDPTSEQAPPPFEITGPEKLDEAVEKAKGIEHPDYKEKTRYHRSTHLSFPLHSIDGADMSQASVTNSLPISGTSTEEALSPEQLQQQLVQERQLQEAGGTEPRPRLDIGRISAPQRVVEVNATTH